ncbi:MAG: nitroreductase family protein [Planctomycetota bacterium]
MSVNPVTQPVLDAIANRWSPYRFDGRGVEIEKLHACFEAARWAASSYNEQPWSFLVAHRDDSSEFARMLGCLLEANQAWAEHAGVLVLTVTHSSFQRNGKPNRVAQHDLGQAVAHFALQAASLGLQVHQMAGVNLSKVRQEYAVPEGFEPQTAIALGYPDPNDPDDELGQELKKRESGPRTRVGLNDQVFTGKWGNPSGLPEGRG